MNHRLLFSIIVPLILLSCSPDKKEGEKGQNIAQSEQQPVEDSESEQSIEKTSIEPTTPDSSDALDSLEMDTELPFRYPCESSFEFVGTVRISETRWEEIQIGKGWDPRRHSCSFVWGEHINNNFPPDSTATDFRMHLVDLDPSQVKLTPEFLQSELFRKHLIVTSISDLNLTTIWDPNNTGKYPKPEQWIE